MNAGVSTGRSPWSGLWRATKPSPRQTGALLAALLLSAAAAYFGYQKFLSPPKTAVAVNTVPAEVGSLTTTVSATGNVVSTKQSKLGFSASSTASGKIAEINVKVGDSVTAGQQLAKLDTQALQAQLDQAASDLRTAQLKLQQVKEGSTPQDKAAAQAAYESAFAGYQKVAAGATAATLQSDRSAVEQARANLVSAQAKLQAAQTPYTEADVVAAKTALDQAQAGLSSAQAKLDAVKNPYTESDWTAAQASVDTAASGIKSAQAKLDQLKSNGGYTSADLASQQAAVDQARQAMISTEDKYQAAQNDLAASGASSVSAAQQSYNAAKASYDAAAQKLQQMMSGALPADLQAAQTAVDQAQGSYNSALAKLNQMKAGPLATDVAQAQSSLDQAKANLASAQAKYDQVMAGPKDTDIVQAQNAVDSATAALASAQAKLNEDSQGPAAADLASARSAVAQAEATLAARNAPQDIDIALAEETVKQAQASYDQAKVNLTNAVLTAPFDGTIAAVNANVGEQVGSSSIFTLVDTSQVRIDGTVGETDVAKVQVGQTVNITFDALPGTALTGKVIAISPSGSSTQGVVSYQVSVSVDEPGRTLPAGMSSGLTIVTEQKYGVLMVPSKALRTQGTTKTVQVLAEGKTETRTVKIGSSNDSMTEIVSGLSAGEQVVIQGTTIKSTSSGMGGPGMGIPGVGGPVGPPQ